MKKYLNKIFSVLNLFKVFQPFLLILSISISLAQCVHAQTTVTLTATADAGIWNNNATEQTKNFGGCNYLYIDGPSGVGKDRSLIRFDLSGIPSNATITSANFKLTKTAGTNSSISISVYRITADWTEGTGGCAGVANVSSSWNNRTTSTPWTTQGGDFDPTATASTTILGNATYSWTVTSLVQNWVDATSPNYGLLVKFTTENTTNGQTFSSTETGTNPPQLVVTYTTPPDPNLTWNTFTGSSGTGLHDGSAVVTDASGNIYVCGSSNATFGTPINAKSSLYDGILVKYNSSGVRQWHTFFGGSGDDFAYGIDLDASGNIYVSGSSAATWGTPLNAFSGDPDGLVIKFNSSGVRQWHTFFGAGYGENGYAIAVDASGNAYVTGNSQNNFGSPVEPYTGGTDGIVLKYNTSGARLWHSYFGGGSNSDRGQGIALDASNNVYVTGYSQQSWGSPIVAPAGGFDGILAKYNGSTGALVWNTYFGSSLGDQGRDVVLDASGNIYVTGQAADTWGTPISAFSSAFDGALVKFNSSGVRQWNTFLGGTGDDIGYGLAADGSGNIYVTGSSTATWGTPVNAYNSSGDGFAARYNTSGALQSNTFFGGSGLDYASAVTLDASDNVIVAASSDATWGTPVNAYAGSAGSQNIAVVKFNAAAPPTAPGGVSAGLLQWLKANDTGVSGGSGTLVDVWQDRSSAARDASQATVANEPILTSNVMNFNPGVVFDGINDNMTYSDAGMVSGAGARATFMVAGLGATDVNNRTAFNYGTNSPLQLYGIRKGSTGSFQVDGNSGNYLIAGLFSTTDKYLLYGGYSGTEVQGAYNGGSIGGSAYTWNTTLSGTGTLGSKLGNIEYWNGPIAEVIHYSGNLSPTDIIKVNSYLAIKYGVTLDQTSPTDYLASDGTIFWNKAINAYDDNIAGIARDDASGLNQKQSKSVNAGLQVTMGNGNTIAAFNATNPNNFIADKSALTWGSNGTGDTWTANNSSAGYKRLNRIWRVQERGTVGSVKVQIPDNSGTDGLPAETTTVSLLVKSVDNNFTTGATIIPMTLVGTNWEANVDFTNLDFFTFVTEYIPPTANTTITAVSCFGGSNGIISLTPIGGTAPYTYLWNGGQTTQNRTGLSAGSYSVTVSDNVGGSSVLNLTVTQPAALTVTGVVTAVTCPLGGAINLTASGGTALYTYNWADLFGTNNPEDRSGIIGGSYAVTVTDAKGCTATNSFSLTSPNCPNITVCKSNPSDVFSVTPDPSVSTYTWTITGGGVIVSGQGSPTIVVNWTGAIVGTGTVCCKTVNACGESTNICQNVYIKAPIPGAAVGTPVCLGSSILLIGSGGVTYRWSGPSGFTANSEAPIINNTTVANSGTYTVTVSDAAGCSSTASATVTVSTPPTATSVISNATCGVTNGTINLSPSSGTSPYTYQWSNGVTTQNLSSVSAATYIVTVTDNKGCKVIHNANVGNTSAQSVALTPTNISCFGGTNGQFVTSITGGTSPFSYFWSNGVTTANLTNVSQGTYSVIVTGADGCVGVASGIITQPNELAVNTEITHINCNGSTTGAINLTTTGGISPYTYNWGGGITNEDRTGLAAGTYSVTITDANSCSLTRTIVVTQPSSPIVATTTVTNVTCNGLANGLIDLTVSGGTLPYSYLWTGGGTTEYISNKIAGTYTVTITDAKGCKTTAFATITQPQVLSLSNVKINISCNGLANGSINLTATGGTVPYVYIWSNGATSEDLNTIGAGIYNVTVTDSKYCKAIASITLTEPAPLTATATATNVTCNNGTNGSISVTPTGGTTAYNYIWASGQTTQNLTNIVAGTYILTVSDANNCKTIIESTLTQPTSISLIGIVTNVVCNGGATGSINLTVNNGVGAITYNWGNGVSSQNRVGVTAGNYVVTVTDANFCRATSTFVITEPISPLTLAIAKIDIACAGDANGSINLTTIGGTSPFTYIWSNGATNENISNLIAGAYSVTVTDASGCSALTTSTITQLATINLSSTVTDASCGGNNNGAIDLTVSGGVTPYDFNWSNGAISEDISGITSGNYTVIVTGANGCSAILSNILVGELTTISVTSTVVNNQCSSGNLGSINLTVTGGTAPLSYSWSNGATTKDIAGLTSGTYSVVIKDATNCVKFYSFIITEPYGTPLVLSAVATSSNCSLSTGTLDLTVTGGFTPYNYIWSNGTTIQDLTSIGSGLYSVTVTDAYGCVQKIANTVSDNAAPTLTATVNNVLCKNTTNGSIILTVSGGITPYSYYWSNNTTASSLTSVGAGTYTVTVSAANGCKKVTTNTITEPTALSLATANDGPTCTGINVDAFATVTGGTQPYSYLWSNGVTTSSASNLPPGTYTVTATDFNNCKINGSTIITGVAPPNAGIASPLSICRIEVPTTIDLYGLLTGEQTGGSWQSIAPYPFGMTSNLIDAKVNAGILNPKGFPVGTYIFRYTIIGNSPCFDDTEDIIVTVSSCCSPVICFPLSSKRL